MGKPLIVFISWFVLQTILSCNPCNCPPARDMHIDFQDMEAIALERLDGVIGSISGDVAFQELVLLVNFEYTSARAACITTSLGFNHAKACDCAFIDDVLFEDAIVGMTIKRNDSSEDISELFGITAATDFDQLLIEHINEFGFGEFVLSLYFMPSGQSGLIGNTSLTIDVTLESGAVFTSTTERINFI